MKTINMKTSLAFLVGLPIMVRGCLVTSGMISSGFETQFEVTTTDNGVQTCSFTCSGDIDDCTGSCISGFSGTIDTDNNWQSYLTLSYCDGSSCNTVQVDATGVTCSNCCGGDAPCSCCQVQYSNDSFC